MAIHGKKAVAMDDHGLVGGHILHRGWPGDSHQHYWTLKLRFRLRTLLIVLALGPLVLATGWRGWQAWREANEDQLAEDQLGIEVVDQPPVTGPQGTTVILPDFAFTTVSTKEPAGGGKVLLGGIRRMRQRQWWWRLTDWQPTSEPRR